MIRRFRPRFSWNSSSRGSSTIFSIPGALSLALASMTVSMATGAFAPISNLPVIGISTATAQPAHNSATCTGSIEWGLEDSFREYLNSPTVMGSMNAQSPATWLEKENTFHFPILAAAKSSIDDPSHTELVSTGGIHATGHDGALDMVLESPRLEFIDSDSATLWLTVTSRNAEDGIEVAPSTEMPFAEVEFSSPINAQSSTTAMVTLSTDGATVMGSRYPQGMRMDDLLLTFNNCTDDASSESTSAGSGQDPNSQLPGSHASDSPHNAELTTAEPALGEEPHPEPTIPHPGSPNAAENPDSAHRTETTTTTEANPDSPITVSGVRETTPTDSPKEETTCIDASKVEISWGIQENFLALTLGKDNTPTTTNRSSTTHTKTAGHIELSSQIKQQGTTFIFPGTQGKSNPSSKIGTLNGEGSIRFFNEDKNLNLLLSNPQVSFADTHGQLTATVISEDSTGTIVDHGTIPIGDLAITNLRMEDSSLRGTAKVTATESGAAALGGEISPGEDLAPIIFTATSTSAPQPSDDPACPLAPLSEHFDTIPLVPDGDTAGVQIRKAPPIQPETKAASLGISGTDMMPWQLGALSVVFLLASAGTLLITSRHPR